MKLINRIRAFLKINHRPVVMDLKSAEIREGYAYLHPKDPTRPSYKVHAEDIEIRLCDGRTLTDSDILPVEKKKQTEKPVEVSGAENEKPKQEKANSDVGRIGREPTPNEMDRFKKKSFSVSLYPEEYDYLVATIKEYGYKRADFILACSTTATKGTMQRAHKTIMKAHNALRQEQKTLQEKQKAQGNSVS